MRSLKDSAVLELRGSPQLKTVGDKASWHDHYRIGAETTDRYIGPDEPGLRELHARQRDIAEAAKRAERERARLMRMLRAEGYLVADPIQGPLLYRSGVLIQVPRHERFAIRKLIVADRRRGGAEELNPRKGRISRLGHRSPCFGSRAPCSSTVRCPGNV